MPAKTKKQQMAAGVALAAKRGETKKSSLKGASKSMEKSMSKKQLEEFASTKRKNLPTKKNQRARSRTLEDQARRDLERDALSSRGSSR